MTAQLYFGVTNVAENTMQFNISFPPGKHTGFLDRDRYSAVLYFLFSF